MTDTAKRKLRFLGLVSICNYFYFLAAILADRKRHYAHNCHIIMSKIMNLALCFG